MPLNKGNAPVSISARRLHAVKRCGQGRRFSPRCTAITETDFRQVLRGNSRSLQGLWVSLRLSPDPYRSAFCRRSSHTFPLQTRALRGRAQARPQRYRQPGKGSPTRLSVIATRCPHLQHSVQRRMGHVSAVLPSCQKHMRAPSVGDN